MSLISEIERRASEEIEELERRIASKKSAILAAKLEDNLPSVHQIAIDVRENTSIPVALAAVGELLEVIARYMELDGHPTYLNPTHPIGQGLRRVRKLLGDAIAKSAKRTDTDASKK